MTFRRPACWSRHHSGERTALAVGVTLALACAAMALALQGCATTPVTVEYLPESPLILTVDAGTVTESDGWWLTVEEPAANPTAYLDTAAPPVEGVTALDAEPDPAMDEMWDRLDRAVRP